MGTSMKESYASLKPSTLITIFRMTKKQQVQATFDSPSGMAPSFGACQFYQSPKKFSNVFPSDHRRTIEVIQQINVTHF
jgi:hypothetical protein